MDSNTQNEFLTQALPLLLHDHDCLVIPGLGGFVAHPVPAQFDEKKGEWVPPGRNVVFNPKLTVRDGLLEQEIRRATGCTNDAASALIDREVEHLRHELSAGNTHKLPGLGRLYLSEAGQVGFAPEPRLGERYSPPGLGRIPWVDLKTPAEPQEEVETNTSGEVQTIPLPIKETEEKDTTIVPTLPGRSLLRVAAVLLLPLLLGGTLWWGNGDHTAFRFSPFTSSEEAPYLPRIEGEDIRFTEGDLGEGLPFIDPNAPALEPAATEAVMPVPAPQPLSSGCRHHVIAGTFGQMDRAAALARRFESLGYSTSILPGPSGQHRVSTGCFPDAASARSFRKSLRVNHGLEAAWVLIL